MSVILNVKKLKEMMDCEIDRDCNDCVNRDRCLKLGIRKGFRDISVKKVKLEKGCGRLWCSRCRRRLKIGSKAYYINTDSEVYVLCALCYPKYRKDGFLF